MNKVLDELFPGISRVSEFGDTRRITQKQSGDGSGWKTGKVYALEFKNGQTGAKETDYFLVQKVTKDGATGIKHNPDGGDKVFKVKAGKRTDKWDEVSPNQVPPQTAKLLKLK